MFCDHCGAPLQAGQERCGRCGKQILGGMELRYVRRKRVQEHTRLLGILWMAMSAFNVVGGIVLLILANTIFSGRFHIGVPPEGTGFLHPLFLVLGFFVIAKAALGFLAGWGLLEHEAWARGLALVMGFISLFNIPLGTALGIYTLWVLLPAQSEQEYLEMSRAA